MKINGDFVLRDVAGATVVVPVGSSAVDFNGMLNLNETGAFLFKALQKGASKQELASLLAAEYDVTPEKAASDTDSFIKKLKDAGLLD